MGLKPERAREENIVNVSHNFYTLHHFVMLAADVMFVRLVLCLVAFAQKIRLRTVEHITNCTVVCLGSRLKKVIQMYGRGGFVINLIMVDQEFEKL